MRSGRASSLSMNFASLYASDARPIAGIGVAEDDIEATRVGSIGFIGIVALRI